MKHLLGYILLLLVGFGVYGQEYAYDVHYYDLNLRLIPKKKRIQGHNTMHYKLHASAPQSIRVNLFPQFRVDSVLLNGEDVSYDRDSSGILVDIPAHTPQGRITVFYGGRPREAPDPPWQGGFVWARDSLDRPWMGVACQHLGASSWWPCKDQWQAEPDSMAIAVEMPEPLTGVANGQFMDKTNLPDGFSRYQWKVSYPINPYGVSVYAGHYGKLSDQHTTGQDTLNLSYFVLRPNMVKAKKHFSKEVPEMLRCYEQFFGRYPFWKDGYKLVESPYWGMEHQSAIAYGEDFTNNIFGFDFILVHESAHEYWGNSITVSSPKDMWVHEAFATYMEVLYLECAKGNDTAMHYLQHIRRRIANKQPMVPHEDVKDTDIYFKGAWMLHTLRHVVNNDSLWFDMLSKLYQEFAYRHVSSADIENFINESFPSINLKPFFEQYLRRAQPPVLAYKLKGKKLTYYWKNVVKGFEMPVELRMNGKKIMRLQPSTEPQSIQLKAEAEKLAPSVLKEKFYVKEEVLD